MQLLPACYLFKGLSESQFLRLRSIVKEKPMRKGQFLMNEGQAAGALFILKNGAVELITTVNDSFELPIAILRNPGDCAGTSALVSPYKYSLSSRCSANGKVLVMEQARLKELITEDHSFGFTIMRNLAEHFLEMLKEARQETKTHFKTFFKSIHS